MTVGKQWAIQGGAMRMCCPTFASQKTTGDQFAGFKIDNIHYELPTTQNHNE